MEIANHPAAMTPQAMANPDLPLLARMMTIPKANNDISRKARHTQGDLTDRESSTEQRSSFIARRVARGLPPPLITSDGIDARLPGADPDDIIGRRHPDLAVTDLVGPRSLDDGVDDALH